MGSPTSYSRAIVDVVRRGVAKGFPAAPGSIRQRFTVDSKLSRRFADVLAYARAAIVFKLIRIVYRRAQTDPWMALAMLERLAPHEWGRKTTTVQDDPDQPIVHRDLYLSLIDQELARRGEPNCVSTEGR